MRSLVGERSCMDMNLDISANRKYKDSVFTMLFNDETVLVQMSNTLLGTHYAPNTEVMITTLKNVLTTSKVNDLSFVLDNRLIVLIEHQSTLSENMPYRMLQYIAEIYKRQIEVGSEFDSRRMLLQRPKFIVLYNGTEEMPEDVRIMRLSDMFAEYRPEDKNADDGEIDLELTVKMYNINRGHNENIIRGCATLHGYSIFIDMIRKYQKGAPLGWAIQKAVMECIEQNILRDFLNKHKGEVVNMLLTDMMPPKEKMEREEKAKWIWGIWGEGREVGIKETAKAMKTKGIDVNTIAEITGMTIEQVQQL